MKILVVQQKMIGDVLTSSILFEALRAKYPDAQLDYVINSHTYAVVENNPFIDNFVFITPEMEKSKRSFYRFLKTLKKEKYDVVIDVYGKLSSTLISKFTSAKTKIAYHKKHTAFVFTHPIKRLKKPENNASLAIENRLKLLEPLAIPFKNTTPKIYLKPEEITNAKTYLETANIQSNQPLFMISVLGSSPIKTYPAKYMAALLDSLVANKKDAQILFNYIPKQKEEAKAIYDYCLAETQKHIYFDVFGKSLRAFLAITQQCDALIGNEGGANNMAKALSIPTFTIFSPYLNKANWFSENEPGNNVAIHVSDYIPYNETDKAEAKKDPEKYYLKLKPEFIKPELKTFLSTL
ncbi:glycosyltransferase family 9 protein [Lacinutrix himadriensis]|uniref:glycosyltransferase family 9 protein n=1 Tax=Lacinutrix himadriensis TaxID=641549 RepID=UPI0006E126A1|nr:glycosyltransferase family 9 protein [Lacinutrix himadriensis]